MFQPDVIVVGGGLIGLACATAIARAGFRTLIVSADDPGSASVASAGILAPSVGEAATPARALGIASRDMYPEFVDALASRTGLSVSLDRSGILEVALTEPEAIALRSRLREGCQWIEGATLRDIEPGLARAFGAVLHQRDGAVDSTALLTALRVDAEREPRVFMRYGRVVRVACGPEWVRLSLESGEHVESRYAVLAPGAWAASIGGLPRPLPVVPVRGQIVAYPAAPFRRVVMAGDGYVVTRGNRSIVGSTMEAVGFDRRTTRDGAEKLQAVARQLSPVFNTHPVTDHWAGLRPVTPDLLPIVGAHDDSPGVYYACGHSKNGVLLAPVTALVIAEILCGRPSPFDITPYSPTRFERDSR